ncbi:MAG: hypothetical protein ACRC06_13220, partial [Waterburya sp.]
NGSGNNWEITFNNQGNVDQITVEDLWKATLTNIENIGGGKGNDILIGDNKNNKFIFSDDNFGGNDVVWGGEGEDSLDFSELGKDVKTISNSNGRMEFEIDDKDKGKKKVIAYQVEKVKAKSGQIKDASGLSIEEAQTPFTLNTFLTKGEGVLLVSEDTKQVANNSIPLTYQQLNPIVEEAIARWQQSPLAQASPVDLNDTIVSLVDLPGKALGETKDGIIYIDKTAADLGWFVDETPGENSEFADNSLATDLDSPAYGKFDLLTVLMHEMGHVLGLPDTDDIVSDLMNMDLTTGTRKIIPEPEITNPIPLTSAAGFVEGEEQSDEEKLMVGLNSFADWAAGYGDILQQNVGAVGKLPFIDSALDQLWSVT